MGEDTIIASGEWDGWARLENLASEVGGPESSVFTAGSVIV